MVMTSHQQFTYRRYLSDRPWLGNEYSQKRYTALSSASFLLHFRMISCRWTFALQAQADRPWDRKTWRSVCHTRGRRHICRVDITSADGTFSLLAIRVLWRRLSNHAWPPRGVKIIHVTKYQLNQSYFYISRKFCQQWCCGDTLLLNAWCHFSFQSAGESYSGNRISIGAHY